MSEPVKILENSNFSNVMKVEDFMSFNVSLVKKLISKKIIIKSEKASINMTLEDQELKFPLVFNGYNYLLNTDLIKSILERVKKDCDKAINDKIIRYKADINAGFNAEFNVGKRLEYLQDRYKEFYLKNYNALNYFDCEEGFVSSTFLDILTRNINLYPISLIKAVTINQCIIPKPYKNMFSEYHDKYSFPGGVGGGVYFYEYSKHITHGWYISYYTSKELTKYLKEQISIMENPVIKKEKSSVAKFTDREKVFLIQAIRDISVEKWDNLNQAEKAKLFNPLIQGSDRNIRGFIKEIDVKPNKMQEASKASFDKINNYLRTLGV